MGVIYAYVYVYMYIYIYICGDDLALCRDIQGWLNRVIEGSRVLWRCRDVFPEPDEVPRTAGSTWFGGDAAFKCHPKSKVRSID